MLHCLGSLPGTEMERCKVRTQPAPIVKRSFRVCCTVARISVWLVPKTSSHWPNAYAWFGCRRSTSIGISQNGILIERIWRQLVICLADVEENRTDERTIAPTWSLIISPQLQTFANPTEVSQSLVTILVIVHLEIARILGRSHTPPPPRNVCLLYNSSKCASRVLLQVNLTHVCSCNSTKAYLVAELFQWHGHSGYQHSFLPSAEIKSIC